MKRRGNLWLFLVVVLQLFEYSNSRVTIKEGVNLTVSAENNLHLHSERGSIIAQDDTEVLKDLHVHGELHLQDSNVLSLLQKLQEAIQNLTETVERQRTELSKIGRAFAYKSVGRELQATWQLLICNVFHFNDFGNDTFNTSTGVFRVPEDGLYRFSIGGYSPSESGREDSRIAFGLQVNEMFEAVGGGQLSWRDSPVGTFTHLVYLREGDEVSPWVYVPQVITIGSTDTGHAIWFQGQYVRSNTWT